MLEIICASSLALSVNVNSCPKLVEESSVKQIGTSQVLLSDADPNHVFLAKGRPSESRYREEADRYQQDYERNHEEVDRVETRDGRIYRDADSYRRQSNERYEGSRNNRIYRDTNYDRQEIEYEPERNRDSRSYEQERYGDDYIRRNSY